MTIETKAGKMLNETHNKVEKIIIIIAIRRGEKKANNHQIAIYRLRLKLAATFMPFRV